MDRYFVKDHHTLEKLAHFWPKIVELIEEIKVGHYSNGSHELSEGLTMNIFGYETNNQEERLFEVHQENIDIHVVLAGMEQVQLLMPGNYAEVVYDLSTDSATFQEVSDEKISCVIGDILVIDTEIAHKTGIMLEEKQAIKKVVFKLKV
ncbi:YhcH/YjgK/YiaL family protein [Vagococcus zengguangii]|nr:YhcH/YjgK/YiaL family protein [Vagococcus zengguangii]